MERRWRWRGSDECGGHSGELITQPINLLFDPGGSGGQFKGYTEVVLVRGINNRKTPSVREKSTHPIYGRD